MKWKQYCLDDIIHIKHGYAFKGEFFSEEPTDDILLTPGNFSIGGGFKTNKLKYYNGEFPVDYILDDNDVIVTMTDLSKEADTLGFTARVPSWYGKRFLHNQRIGLLSLKSNEFDLNYLYWLMRTYSYQRFVANGATGATVKHTSPTKICSYTFTAPENKDTQRKIASILSAYDNLIENNLKRIKLLEDKARIEFKSIQKNEKLEIKKAVEVLQFTTGKLNSNAAIKNGLYPFFTCGQEILRTNTFSVDEEVVLLGGNNASAIYPVFYYKGKFDAYQRTYIIKPKPEINISFKYLYFFWEDKLDYLKNISTGAATKFLTLKILNDIDVPLPNKKIMDGYEKLTDPIFKLIAILVEQNTKLREARDILLPRLMNGQIEVS
jgi:type I restriction enzyme S subunit